MQELYSNGHKLDLGPGTYGELRDSYDVLDDSPRFHGGLREFLPALGS